MLADAFGNTIDHVEYLDTAPWPVEPDGSGPHLELNNINADNSVATNWSASSQALAVNDPSLENTIILYPNPMDATLRIQNNNIPISSYEIYDLIGRKMISKKGTESASNGIDISQLKPNTYFIKLNFDNGSSATKKIIKY
ncbi:MAG: T9SS type A sorting domain-containing protein [Flavobacteriaceae bacterium]|nr:T9SS type A sorting domain-containing protein [Flavobacteriaceae bacterium]